MSISYSLSSKSNFYYPNSWLNRDLHGKTYLILDGKALIRDYFVYDSELMEWEKKTGYFVGIEGAGKTNTIRFATWVLNQIEIYRKNGIVTVSTNDLRILGDHNFEFLFKNESVINLILDDAIGGIGTNSSEFMSSAGIDVTKKFVTSRHKGRALGNPVGIVFMTFATQSWMRLNPVIRENAKLKLFNSYMDTKYFQELFPPQEAEFIQGKYHEAHFSSKWKERKYAICRTGGGGIATVEIPFVPDCQEALDWCRKLNDKGEPNMKPTDYISDIVYTVPITCEADFQRNKNRKNIIFQIDRSIDKGAIIDRMATYLRTHPKILFLIKYHPKRHSLDDFSRGKLKGILREEAKRIEDEFCVVVKKEDMISAIDQALKDEEFSFVEKLEKGEKITKEERKPTAKNRIIYCFRANTKKTFHISELCSITGLDVGQVKNTLTQNKNTFVNIIKDKGYWSLATNKPTQEELDDFISQNEIKMQPKNLVVSTLKMEAKA